jgi:hypothetical protein
MNDRRSTHNLMRETFSRRFHSLTFQVRCFQKDRSNMMLTNEFANLRSDFSPLKAHLTDELAKQRQNVSWKFDMP